MGFKNGYLVFPVLKLLNLNSLYYKLEHELSNMQVQN